MINNRVTLAICALVFAQIAHGQEQQPQPPTDGSATQPQQQAGVEVVFPSVSDVVDESLREIEDAQLTPEQIARVKKMMLEREMQTASPYVNPPTPITRTLPVSLDPGISPPVIRLARGQLTSIVFSDYNGSPWLIESVHLNRTLFCDQGNCGGEGGQATQQNSQQKPTNILTIEAKQIAAYGNVSVTMRGLATPVIFILTTAQNEIDMRIDAKIPGRNPDSMDATSVTNAPSLDSDLMYFLDGVPPSEAQSIKVIGMENVDAWLYKNNMYVRAAADAQYPAYRNAAKSTSGLSVYRYAQFHDSITFLRGGKAITIFLEKRGN